MTVMRPVDALEEIALHLERQLASSFKTKAFRAAARVVGALSDEEVAATAADGSLAKLKGIGSSSWAVIEQALEGRVPEYLAGLRATADPPLTGEAARLRGQLRGDLHSHSEWSDGTTPIDSMAQAARALGHDYLVLTDHSPRLRIANGLSSDRLRAQLKVVDELNDGWSDFTLLRGIEVDILDDGGLDQTPQMLDRLDVVVASVHSKLRMDRREMTERMLGAIADPHTAVLGHCTGRLVAGSRGTRPESDFDAARVFAACAEAGVAVEINSRPERRDPPDRLVAMALEAGCLFSIDSDAHAPGHLGFIDLGAARAVGAGIPPERIVTTWPLDRLRDWARARR